jgi:mRNA interferase RelE/StbE
MQPYRIEFKKSARKELDRLHAPEFQRISDAIDELENTPHPIGSKKLKGSESKYRIRVDDFRIIYEVKNTILVIFVIKVGHRKDIYR